MREKIIQLDEQIKKEELTEKELRGYIDALQNDRTIERLLRENGFIFETIKTLKNITDSWIY